MDPHLLSVHIDHNVIITEATEAFCRATGFENADLVGRPLMALGSPVQASPNSHAHIWETLKNGNTWEGEVELLKKDGSVLWVEAVVSPLRRKNEKKSGYTAIYQDVTERKYFEKLAVRDELTGLYNRRHFNEIVPTLLSRARDENRVFALILMDVDNFKKYNDNYGHPAGDKVLEAIGQELRDIFQRSDDMVFRMGGEEFAAVVVIPDPDDAMTFGNKILARIRSLEMEHEYNPPGVVTVSIGINTVGGGASIDLDTVYKNADDALYRAKESGRNCIVIERVNGVGPS
jgi:diguanylate cyclase (GGDEF)-like protein/PAS domain S-box-containing protein